MSRAMSPDDRAETLRAFKEAVNMTPASLRKWLAAAESRGVGMLRGGGRKDDTTRGESVGHHMGARILEIKARKKSELSDQDFADMRKVTGYVHRHMKQRPDGDVGDTRWRKSLMNWGHDPLK